MRWMRKFMTNCISGSTAQAVFLTFVILINLQMVKVSFQLITCFMIMRTNKA